LGDKSIVGKKSPPPSPSDNKFDLYDAEGMYLGVSVNGKPNTPGAQILDEKIAH